MTNIKKTALFICLGLAMFFIARIWLFVEYYSYFGELSVGEILFGFIHGIRFDANIIFTFLAPMILFFNLPFKFTQSKIYGAIFSIYSFVVLLVLIGINFGDIAYFDECKRHMGNELFMLGGDSDFIISMLPLYFFHTLAIIVLGVVLGFAIFKLNKFPSLQNPRRFLTLFLLILLSFVVIRGSFGAKPITIANAFISSNSKQGTLSLNGVFTSFINYKRSDKKDLNYLSLDEAIKNLGLKNEKFPLVQQYDANKTGLNVVLILFEGWNIDFIGAYGSKENLTPNFDEIAKNSMKFNNFFACGQRSIEGIQCAMTGILSVPGNLNIGFGLENSNLPRLGEILKKNDYATIAGQTSKRASYYVDAIFKLLGFDDYFGQEDMKILLDYPEKKFPKFGWDYEGFDTLLKHINSRKNEHFFGFLFTGTTHTPYPRLQKQFEKFPYDSGTGINGYKNTIIYADWALGEFIKNAKKQPWFDDTIFIITGDHTVKVSADKYYSDFYHIPFLIYSPKHVKAQTVNTYASHVQIMPTIIDLMGFSDKFYALYPSIFKKDMNPIMHSGDGSFGIVSPNGYVHRTTENIISSDLNASEKQKNDDILFSIASLFYHLALQNRLAP